MNPRVAPRPSVFAAARHHWADLASQSNGFVATRTLLGNLWAFLRDSTPSRLRQRYGDADYDWDHRVNTTSAAVGWRDRLLGVFHSPYQPTEPVLFREMLEWLQENERLDFRDYIFVDLGSGKGRTLLMASDYPFRRVIGVEILPSLHRVAQDNLRQYKSDAQKCFALEAICADATAFPLPEDPLLMYLFNPFPESGLRKVTANLEESLRTRPRPVYVLYHNPLLERVLTASSGLEKIGGTHQYAVFKAVVSRR